MLICVTEKINDLKQKIQSGDQSNSTELVSIPIEELRNEEIDTSEGKTKMTVKIFLNEYYEDWHTVLNHIYKVSTTPPSVILAYSPHNSKIQNEKYVWGENDEKAKENFKKIWARLREERNAGRIEQLGIADIDLDTINSIFDDKNYDFNILQINVITCCIPPPALVNFCKDHEIQLLTHSDPQGKIFQLF